MKQLFAGLAIGALAAAVALPLIVNAHEGEEAPADGHMTGCISSNSYYSPGGKNVVFDNDENTTNVPQVCKKKNGEYEWEDVK